MRCVLCCCGEVGLVRLIVLHFAFGAVVIADTSDFEISDFSLLPNKTKTLFLAFLLLASLLDMSLLAYRLANCLLISFLLACHFD